MNYRYLLLGLPILCAVHCAEPASSDDEDNNGSLGTNEDDSGVKGSGGKDAHSTTTDSGGKGTNSQDEGHSTSTSTDPRPQDELPDGGKLVTPRPNELDEAGTEWRPPDGQTDAGVQVGDVIDGQKVVDVYISDDCVEVELESKPLFQCTSEQLARLTEGRLEEQEAREADTPDLQATDCASLADLRRPALKNRLLRRLEDRYLDALASYCEPQTHYAYIQDGEWSDGCNYWGADAGVQYADEDPSDEGEPMSGSDEASDYSTTNTQVKDVDEADWVKNDGGTLYVLNNSQLVVFDAWPIEDMNEVARLELPAEPRRMFLDGDRLVVYLRDGVSPGSQRECTYGYDCRSASEGGSTQVQVYDVSEPEAPLLLKEYQFSGAYLSSRRIGSSVYSVLHDEGASDSIAYDVYEALDGDDPDELDDQFEHEQDQIEERVRELPVDYFLPSAAEREPGAEYTQLEGCDEALASQVSAGTSFVSIVGFDLQSLATPKRTLLGSKPGFVYASADALYLAVDGVDGQDDGFSDPWAYEGAAQSEQSTIHKFALADAKASYAGTSKIPGHVLNQFSMDEHEAVLRVATSSGWVPDPGTASNIVTLAEVDGEFQVLGKLTGLAPTEDIRSVRFDGERGFVVTFKKTDPLFVIGLSEPEAPKVLGELKIPGFSTYMHLLDESHLLAVGFDADDHDDFAFFDGIQVQIFDVTDLAHPALLHKAVIGTRGSGSEALMDHLAFNYFPSRGVLALPATVCQGGDDGQFGDQFEFSGLIVFDVSVENGISERGRLPFVTPQDVEQMGSPECSVWWSNSSSLVKRSIFLEDYAIGLSDDWLKAAALANLDSVLQAFPVGDGKQVEEVYEEY